MTTPMNRQIAEDLRAQIESESLQPGQQLRTEQDLQKHYGASRNTVRDAIRQLISLGLVETRPGQGTFVVPKIDPYITDLTANPKIPTLYGEVDDSAAGNFARQTTERVLSSTDPQIEIRIVPGNVAAQLLVTEGSQVVSRHQRRYIDGTPWSLQTSFYPMEFVLNGADRLIQSDNITVGIVKYLADTLGLKQAGYRDWISARMPNATEATFFNLPEEGRVGVFEVCRTAFDQTGTPMRLTVTVFPTDRNQFVVNVEGALNHPTGTVAS